MKIWEKTRKMGKINYIILYGVLIWGIVAGLSFPFIQWIFLKQPLELHRFVMSLIVFQIIGIFVGNALWNKSERMYQQFLDKEKPKTGE